MKKKQRLVAIHVNLTPEAPGAPVIQPVGTESLEEILESWRIVQIQPLGAEGAESETGYAALLLLEEISSEASLGRLGFGQT